ncbi:MAG: hypothetical protein R3F17_02680 [Planctomycetota bacterium]
MFFGTITRDAGGALSWHQSLASDGYATLCWWTYWAITRRRSDRQPGGRIYAMVNGSFGSEPVSMMVGPDSGWRYSAPVGPSSASVVTDSPLCCW